MEMPISRASAYQKRNRTTHSWYGNWGGTNDVMSRSCPATSTLEDHMRAARASRTALASSFHLRGSDVTDSVVRSKSATRPQSYVPSSTASSPGPTSAIKIPQSGRRGNHLGAHPGGLPSNAYSYDGGFFVTANNPHKDYFVINPEWVSESPSAASTPRTSVTSSQDAPDGAGKVVVKKGGPSHRSGPPPKVITWKSYSKRSKSAPPPKYRNPITWVDDETKDGEGKASEGEEMGTAFTMLAREK